MEVNGMEVEWGQVLWCEDCDEIMNWGRTTGYWTCPVCENSVRGKTLSDEE